MQAYCFRFYFLSVTVIIFGGMVCKATAKLLTKKVRSMTSPHQFAVGMKQGLELLHKIVSAHVAIHRDAAMASVDAIKRPRCG